MSEGPWEELRSVDGARGLSKAIGRDVVRSWHAENPVLDALTVVWALGEMALAVAGTALLPYGPLWAVCAVAQPFILFHWIMVGHDLCTHRKFGGATFSWLLSLVLALPRFSPPTRYLHNHQLHHRFIGSDHDGERYKQHITGARRWFYLTLPGALIAPRWGKDEDDPLPAPTPERARRIRTEVWILRAYLLLLLVGCVVWPKVFLFGHLLPVILLGPPLNTLRILLEHAEADDSAPLFLGIRYRAGPFLSALSLWNTGDAHIVHHLFPNIPWYRIPAALRAIRPYLDAAGIPERRSLLAIWKGWLVDGRPHRSRWPDVR